MGKFPLVGSEVVVGGNLRLSFHQGCTSLPSPSNYNKDIKKSVVSKKHCIVIKLDQSLIQSTIDAFFALQLAS